MRDAATWERQLLVPTLHANYHTILLALRNLDWKFEEAGIEVRLHVTPEKASKARRAETGMQRVYYGAPSGGIFQHALSL
jgi:hypothetical protein